VVFLLTGVFMALLGGEIIGWLTNGKFYEAWPVSVAFIAAFLIQTAGKPQMALLIASKNSITYSNLVFFSSVLGIVALLILVPFYGAIGVALALILRNFILRIMIVYTSRKIRYIKSQDGWVYIGLLLIAVAFLINLLMELSIAVKLLLFMLVCGLLIFFMFDKIKFFLNFSPQFPDAN